MKKQQNTDNSMACIQDLYKYPTSTTKETNGWSWDNAAIWLLIESIVSFVFKGGKIDINRSSDKVNWCLKRQH